MNFRPITVGRYRITAFNNENTCGTNSSIKEYNVVRTSNMKVRDILSTFDEDSAFIHTTQKILRGDKLIIIKDGKEYTVDGQLLQ